MERYLEKINLDLKTKCLTDAEKDEVAEKMKTFLSKESIVFAQTNPISGNIDYNYNKAFDYIEWANKLSVSAIIFPELFLFGYPIGDLFERFPYLVEKCQEYLEKLALNSKETKIIIGYPQFNEDKFGKKFYNSVAVLQNGKIEKIIKKTLLPNYSEFNDYRYFEPSKESTESKVIYLNGFKTGILICEDMWNDYDFFEKNLYKIDPLGDLMENEKPEIIINCSASISRTNKEQLKNNMLSFLAKKYGIKLLYVNQVGSNDELSFDGSSRAYDEKGELSARAKSFDEDFFIYNPKGNNKINPLPKGLEIKVPKKFSLDYENDLERTYLSLIQSIRDYFFKNSLKKAVIGLSGGLDSSITAVLLADALGEENVYGISIPSKITSDLSKCDAKQLADNLKINFMEVPIYNQIEDLKIKFKNIFDNIEENWNDRYEISYTNDNIQARLRSIILWGIANEFEKTIPIATSDKSELYMGYATINGDMSGGFAVIADVTKTKLFALARWLNENRNIKDAIPVSVINKPPGAELAINPKNNKPLLAEEALMPYEFLDEIIWRVENLHQKYNDMIDSSFIYEKTHKITKEQKSEWLKKFFARLSGALYKWSIMPVSPIIDAHSINRAEYKQPIISKLRH